MELSSADQATAVWDKAVQLARTRKCRVTAALIAQIQAQALKPVYLSSASNDWGTPAYLVKLAREVFDEQCIDLDPCSTAVAQRTVKARRFLGKSDDSLQQPWCGRVFINPPFGVLGSCSQQGLFLRKALEEHGAGRASEVLLLLKAAIGYSWFQQVFQLPHAFLKQKVSFVCQDNSYRQPSHEASNPHGTVVVYLGKNVHRFCHVFSEIAAIPGCNSWSRHASGCSSLSGLS